VTLPPVILGAIFLISFLAVLALRRPMERFFVLRAAGALQPKRQFLLDFSLCLVAASAVMLYNMAVFTFPVISGFKVITGYTIVGFFLSLDMALCRERAVLREAIAHNTNPMPSKRFSSMSRKFFLVAFSTTLFVSVIIGLVISGDIAWLAKIEQNTISMFRAQWWVMYELFFVLAVILSLVANLIFSYSKNMKLLFDNQTSVLDRVNRGDLSRLVPIATTDEFGVIAGHTNDMIHGLRHRTQLIASLKLAEEIQQNLLIPFRIPSSRISAHSRAMLSNKTTLPWSLSNFCRIKE
jgi:sigma-B regulation protein RsbU (phosphoserine phosphatase)